MPEFQASAYDNLSNAEIEKRILEIKKEYGNRLLILTHHYQRNDVVKMGDCRGDSLALARTAAKSNADFIVFCGVQFMAESADILTKKSQKVHLPDMNAGCPMANMAEIEELEAVWDELNSIHLQPVPVVYINSSAETKAFCGDKDGSVCTSANAETIIKWGLGRSGQIFFLPDQHLGRNIANKLGIPKNEIITWDPTLPMGGNELGMVKNAKILLWKGFCHVHTHFKVKHLLEAKKKYPDAKIVVHLETDEELVKLADGAGSTSFIEKFVKKSEDGAVIFIGTELNMVERLAKENPAKKIYELSRSLCPNMYKTDLPKLLFTLENLGKANLIKVPENIKGRAIKPLERMLSIMDTSPSSIPDFVGNNAG